MIRKINNTSKSHIDTWRYCNNGEKYYLPLNQVHVAVIDKKLQPSYNIHRRVTLYLHGGTSYETVLWRKLKKTTS